VNLTAAAPTIPRSVLPLPYSFSFTPGERRVFAPREPLTVSQHAAKYRIVTKGNHKGAWSNDLVPYLVRPMDTWCLPHVRKIFLCFAPQTAKTQFAMNCMNFEIDQDPCSVMYIMPDEKVAKRISRRRIIPMFRSSPRLASLLSPRSDDTTTLAVAFLNGADLMMTWATSAAELASEDVRVLIEDEIDKWPEFSDREAAPMALAEMRTRTYPHTKKIAGISSPSPQPSRIWACLKYDCDVVYKYAARCPVCGREQVMIFDNFTWPSAVHDPREIMRLRLAHYVCEECGFKWDDHMRNRAVSSGRWVPGRINEDDDWEPCEEPGRPSVVGFHLASWYSPDVSLSEVVASYLKGKEDPAEDIVFVTQHKAEEHKEVIEKKKEAEVLSSHLTALEAGIIPKDAVALTLGADSHKNYFKYVVRAWIPEGYVFRSQKIEHGIKATLADIEALAFTQRWPVEGSDYTMGIWRGAIDTGGSETNVKGFEEDGDSTLTEEIYQWLRNLPPGRMFGVKGASREQINRVRLSVIDKFPHSNKPIPGGLELRLLDTSQFKSLIHYRLGRKEGETQRFLLDAETKEDYILELLAEEKRRDRRKRIFWKKIRNANHYLDCEVYAMACADSEWTPSLRTLAGAFQKAIDEGKARSAGEESAPKTREDDSPPDAPRRPAPPRDFERPSWMER